MLIVVTGSSGRLGRVVVRDLIEHGHDVRPIDRKSAGDADAPLTCLADLRQAADLVAHLKGADAVCHLANTPSIMQFPLTDELANNVTATHGVFEAAAKANVKRIIYASSIQAYGVVNIRPGVQPTPPRYLPIDEDHPLLPRDAYPLSKAMGEWIADSFVRAIPEMTVYSLRFTHITEKIPSGSGRDAVGGALFTAVHPLDAALAVRLCCEQERRGHTALNIVSPQSNVPWQMSWLREYYGQEFEMRRELKATDALIAGDRAREILGFEPRHMPSPPNAA